MGPITILLAFSRIVWGLFLLFNAGQNLLVPPPKVKVSRNVSLLSC
jgi:hypothetical protein